MGKRIDPWKLGAVSEAIFFYYHNSILVLKVNIQTPATA